MLTQLLIAFFLSTSSLATPIDNGPKNGPALTARSLTTPQIVSYTKAAITIDPNLQRDSCVTASALIGGRALWICRDTIPLINQTLGTFGGFISSTASWSNQNSSGLPDLVPIPTNQGQKFVTDNYTYQLTQYGEPPSSPYLYYAADECPSSGGGCPNGTRVIEWPDAPAYVTNVAGDGTTTAYVFDTLAVEGGNATDNHPATTLYKLTYSPNTDVNVLPTVTMVSERFFPRFAWNYGAFGGVIGESDGLLYLWGETYDFGNGNQTIGLARVATSSVEDIGSYEYYYPATASWSATQPTIFDSNAQTSIGGIEGQGTFFFSKLYNQYVYVGQSANGVMQVGASTALLPEGPWTPAKTLCTLPSGSSYSYSLAAHPEMSTNPNELYVSYTQQFTDDGNGVYEQPLYILNFVA